MALISNLIKFVIFLTTIAQGASIEYKIKSLKLGVEITGINLRDHLNDTDLFDKIKEDSYKYRLIVIRNQGEIPADQMIEMFRRFGRIYHEPYTTQTKDMSNHPKAPAPAIMRISNDIQEGFKGVGTSGWHIDGAYKSVPYSHLIFNSVKAPIMGDTKFAGHREMLASMPKEILKFMDRIWAVNTRTVLGEKIAVIHPLIYNHPINNDSVLCLHLGYMLGAISDYGHHTNQRVLSHSELLQLKGQINHGFNKDNERLIYSHKWKDGDLVIIDNLQISHLASKESQMPKEKVGLRILHRLAVIGFEKPTKKIFSIL